MQRDESHAAGNGRKEGVFGLQKQKEEEKR